MAAYLPHPVDYDSLNLDQPVQKMKYIGPYIAERFLTASFWPVTSRNVHPITTLRDLRDFLRSRRPLRNTRANMTLWLERVMSNARPEQCVEQGKDVPPDHHLYHVRRVNECGFNAVVGFWSHHFPDRPHRSKIPRPKLGRSFPVKYPQLCRV